MDPSTQSSGSSNSVTYIVADETAETQATDVAQGVKRSAAASGNEGSSRKRTAIDGVPQITVEEVDTECNQATYDAECTGTDTDEESKLRVFRTKCRSYEEELSRVRADMRKKERDHKAVEKSLYEQLKKAQAESSEAVKKSNRLQSALDIVRQNEDCLSKQLANSKKTADKVTAEKNDAVQRLTNANRRAVDAEAKMCSNQTELKAAVEMFKDAEKKISLLENELKSVKDALASEQKKVPSSSGSSKRPGRVDALSRENWKLKFEIASLKQKNQDLERKVKELETTRQNEERKTLLDARVKTTLLQQLVLCMDQSSDVLTMKWDANGVVMQGDPARENIPVCRIVLNSQFFSSYEHIEGPRYGCVEVSIVHRVFSAMALKKDLCCIGLRSGCYPTIGFKNSDSLEGYMPSLILDSLTDRSREIAEPPYKCVFTMNSNVLTAACGMLNPIVIDYAHDVVTITDAEDHIHDGSRDNVFKSCAGVPSNEKDFKVTFHLTTDHVRLFVDPKYMRLCTKSSVVKKTVRVSLSEDLLKLEYEAPRRFLVAYFVPTVKPNDAGERSYSPIGAYTLE